MKANNYNHELMAVRFQEGRQAAERAGHVIETNGAGQMTRKGREH
jgi:hypothetical protein